MTTVEPSFVLYALLLDPDRCLRAHIILIELVSLEKKKWRMLSAWQATWRRMWRTVNVLLIAAGCGQYLHTVLDQPVYRDRRLHHPLPPYWNTG